MYQLCSSFSRSFWFWVSWILILVLILGTYLRVLILGSICQIFEKKKQTDFFRGCIEFEDQSGEYCHLNNLKYFNKCIWEAFPLFAAAAKLLQSCPTLCDPIYSSPPGSAVTGILQARTLEWVAISFSNAWNWKVKVKSLSHVWLFTTAWSAAYQPPPFMGFSRQEYWSGVPLPSPFPLFRSSLIFFI